MQQVKFKEAAAFYEPIVKKNYEKVFVRAVTGIEKPECRGIQKPRGSVGDGSGVSPVTDLVFVCII